MAGKIRDNNIRSSGIFFILVAMESLAVAIYLTSLPGDPKNSLLLGFSAQRLVLIAGMLFAFLFFGYLVLRGKNAWVEKLARERFYLPALVVLAILFLAGFLITQVPQSLLDPTLLAYYERLYPILLWLWIVSFEAIVYLTWLRFGWTFTQSKLNKQKLYFSFIAAMVFLVLTIFILRTQYGLSVDSESWRKMGSPLLAWQVGLAITAGIILLVVDHRFLKSTNRWLSLGLDAGLLLVLYSLALALWLPQPLQNSYFSPEPRPPNQEVYPYSDALYYGIAAESVTIGTGLYGGEVTPRPFYLAILSYITAAARGDYTRIITFQTLLLALVPVFLYLIGKQLMGRPLGFTIGLLGIFRELNAILSTRYIELSNSKMIMADLPSLLAVLIFTWLFIRWWKSHRASPLWAIGVGGALGWVMLFRTQAILLLPLIFLFLIGQAPRRWRVWLLRCGLVCAGVVLMISPWLIRNYAITGKIIFDDPATQTQFLQLRLGMDVRDPNLNGSVFQLAMRNPGTILAYTTNHFLRNEIGTLFVTPPQRFIETVDTVMTELPFWRDDLIALSVGQMIQLIVTLGLIAIGIGSLFVQLRWVGLIPIGVNIAYTLSNAFARNSSGRYNLPVDWIGYLYLSAGLLQIAIWILQGLRRVPVDTQLPLTINDPPISRKFPIQKWFYVAIPLILIGSFIPITEQVFPKKYQAFTSAEIPALVKQWGVDPTMVVDLLADSGVTYVYGRELYPRFYKPGIGEMGSNWVAYAPLDFCRMGFVMSGPAGIDQVLVTLDRPPQVFPNRSDTLAVGRIATGYVRGKAVEYLHADLIIQPGNPPVVIEGQKEPPVRCRLQ